MSSEHFAKKNIVKQRPHILYLRFGGADKETHSHPHPEFIFVVSGSGRFETGENQYPIKTGDLIICGKGVPHSEYMFDAPGTEVYHLGFDKTVISGMDEDEIIGEPFCVIHTDTQMQIIRAYFAAIMQERTAPRLSGKIIEEDLMRVLLLSALRLAVSDMRAFSQNKAFYEAKDYFDKNFLTITNIEQACSVLNVNKFYLTHIFKEQLGMPPIKYLTLKRMDRAKNLLSTSDFSIGEVASKCGYPDTAYFCRVFKKSEGITPLHYRAKIRRQD